MNKKDKTTLIGACILTFIIVSLGYISAAGVGFFIATNGSKIGLVICVAVLFIVLSVRFRNIIRSTQHKYKTENLINMLDNLSKELDNVSKDKENE